MKLAKTAIANSKQVLSVYRM